MWLSKTPLRISLFSGGDMKSFYSHAPGYCLSVTIDKYVYVTMLQHPITDYKIRTMYDVTETVNDLNEIKHDIVREALARYDMEHGCTIASMTDIPASGTGLGSSSAFTVGLLNCLIHASGDLGRECNHKYHLAEEACELEIEQCGHPIGKQDQYAAAIGGLNYMKFWNDNTVDISTSSGAQIESYKLQWKLVLVYTGIGRSANEILKVQNENLEANYHINPAFAALERNGARAAEAYNILRNRGDMNYIGELLHEAWVDKKRVAEGITNPRIDEIYELAMKNGAIGGKVIGAGGGGFMIFYVPEHNKRWRLEQILTERAGLAVYPFQFVDHGSQVLVV